MKPVSMLCLALAPLILSAVGAGATLAQEPQPTQLREALIAARHSLVLGPDGFSGGGAPVLGQAVRDARFILVGEDHLTREIPRFTSALCDMLAPQGLSALVLEVGPRALSALTPILASPDRERLMVRFNRDYPSAIAFLNMADDNAMAAHCLRGGSVRLIGVDQEFLGSAGLLLDRILATRLSRAGRAAVERLRKLERERAAAAAMSGKPADLFLLTVTDAELADAEARLAKGGSPAARAIFRDLRASRDLYRRRGNESNQIRARLLKRNLRDALPAQGKVLGKFGDWHAYKGYNPFGNRDLGNYVAEIADAEDKPSLHILVLGAKGTRAFYGGYARPITREPFVLSEEAPYRWFEPAAANQVADGWTLFDLRRLRQARPIDLDTDWRRVIDGFDLLIVIPEITPSTEMNWLEIWEHEPF